MNKRGMQIIFTYIFIVVLIGFVLYFGFYGVSKFIEFNNKAEIKSFETNFDRIVQNVYALDTGSKLEYSKDSRYKPLITPKDVVKICIEESKVVFNFKDNSRDYFTVKNLKGNECFDTIKGFSFIMENKVINEIAMVEIKNVQ